MAAIAERRLPIEGFADPAGACRLTLAGASGRSPYRLDPRRRRMSSSTPDEPSPSSAHSVTEDACWQALGSMAVPDAGTEAEMPVAVGRRMAQLASTIEHEIIPRLMLAHRVADAPAPPQAGVGVVFDAAAVQRFGRLVIGPDDRSAWAEVEALLGRGVAIERIYLELLAAAARCLGQWWTEDRCDFTAVTIGLGRLQRIMRELSPSFGRLADPPLDPMRVLLLPSPGEQHTFGLVMVAEFFRRDGWEVSGGAWESGDDAPRMVAAEWFDVLGLSLAAEVHVEAVARCIADARGASRNRELAVIVGGPLVELHPQIGARVGADRLGADGRSAPALAAEVVSRRRRHQ
jgi:methylmalonyl-CoA mutase cobalamin-binding subunit